MEYWEHEVQRSCKYLPGYLRNDGRISRRVRLNMKGCRQNGDADEECTKDDSHPCQSNRRIAWFRLLKGGHTIRNRLHTCHRRTTRGKRPENQKECEWFDSFRVLELTNYGVMLNKKGFNNTYYNQQKCAANKDVGRNRKDGT